MQSTRRLILTSVGDLYFVEPSWRRSDKETQGGRRGPGQCLPAARHNVPPSTRARPAGPILISLQPSRPAHQLQWPRPPLLQCPLLLRPCSSANISLPHLAPVLRLPISASPITLLLPLPLFFNYSSTATDTVVCKLHATPRLDLEFYY